MCHNLYMNDNLKILLDQLSFAPVETKAEIIAIMVSENCFPATVTESRLCLFILGLVSKIGYKGKVKELTRNHMIDNDNAEKLFFSLINQIIMNEDLSLIQDFLYAVKLSNWRFNPNDVKNYINSVFYV